MRRLRRVLLALLCALIALPAAARPFSVALQLEPPTLDPTGGASAAIAEVAHRTIFEGLTTLDATGLARPLLATGWTRSPDGLSYLFHLRPGVRFTDGTPFDARVARFSLARAARPGSPDPQAAALAGIIGLDVIDLLTLRIHLRSPDATLPVLLARAGCVMVPPAAAATLATQPVGTGPFRLGSWARGDRLTLVRNDAYWGRPAGLPTLVFRFIADPAQAYAAVRTHAVDLFPDYPAPENLDALRADPTLRVSTAPSEGEVILALNNRWGPLRDLRVRRAIGHALDRRAIIDGAMFGHGTPIGSHYPPQDGGYVDLTAASAYDPARARALLAEAGYPHGFDVVLTLPPPSYARRSGEIVAAQLRAVGLRVRVVPIEWVQWLDQVFGRHAYAMTIVNHAEFADYDIYARPDYYFGYDGAAVRQALARLRAAGDPLAERQALAEIQRRIAADAVNAFLFQFPHLQVADARLGKVWINTPLTPVDLAAIRPLDQTETLASAAPSRAGLVAGVVAIAMLALFARVAGWRALAGRVAVLAITLFGASLVIFWATQAAPGDPAQYMLGLDASPRAVAQLRADLGLGGSPLARYGQWLAGLVRGDLGTSYTYRVPVADLVAPRLAVSLPLTLLAMLLSVVLGLTAALLGARRPGGWVDRLLGAVAQIGLALPSFWLAMVLLLLFAVRLRWVEAAGFPGWEGGAGPAWRALLLPAIALGLPQAAVIARVARASLADASGQDHIRTARAKGLSETAILWRHALPNALPPILAIVGLQLPFLLAGSVIVETVFGLPGIGRLVLDAIGGRDLVTVGAVAMLLAAATVAASFAVDLAQRLVDPRLRSAR